VSRGWLIDTNIVPEWVKPRPDVGVVRRLDEVDDHIFLSLVEIHFGVERLAPGRRRTRLDAWLREELPARFERRIVPVDGEVADACGHLLARVLEAGRGLGAMDALIAAACVACDLVLATRNLADFDGLGIALHVLRPTASLG
jgi:predicted nucleic acid-binding protein